MKKIYLGITIVLACAALSFGQMDKGRKTRAAESDKSQSGIGLMSDTRIDAQLQKTVDVNNARVGDNVVLRVTKSIKQNGEVVVPKGSDLVGRITEVQRRGKHSSESRLGIIFDRLQDRGLSTPLSASIVSITDVAGHGAVGDSLMTDTSGSSQTSASGSGGGGLLGGVGSTLGGVINTTTQAAGAVTNTVTQTTGNATEAVGRSVNGIQITSSASSTTTLSSQNKNLRVEKGATFNLRVDN